MLYQLFENSVNIIESQILLNFDISIGYVPTLVGTFDVSSVVSLVILGFYSGNRLTSANSNIMNFKRVVIRNVLRVRLNDGSVRTHPFIHSLIIQIVKISDRYSGASDKQSRISSYSIAHLLYHFFY